MHKTDEKKNLGRGFVMSVAFGTAIGFILILILFAIFAAVIASGKISENSMRYIAFLSAFAGALTGAVAAVKRHRARIITIGLAVGGLEFLLTFIGSLLLRGTPGNELTPGFLVAFIAGGIAGGLLNLKRKKHKHS
jgi:putative membrane protein (TIGR04086 family)